MHAGDIYTGQVYNSSYGWNTSYQYIYALHPSGPLFRVLCLGVCSTGTALRIMFCNGIPSEIPIEICKQGYRNTAKLPLEELKLPVEQHLHELITPQVIPILNLMFSSSSPSVFGLSCFPVFPWSALFIFSSVNSRSIARKYFISPHIHIFGLDLTVFC